jgi:DNA-directed RNA polymerase, mitochondrial
MDTNELPLELSVAIDKVTKRNARAIRSAGYGASDAGLELSKNNLGTLTEFIRERMVSTHGNTNTGHFLRVAQELSPELLALVALQCSIHGVAMDVPNVELFVATGTAVAAECWAAGLTKEDPRLAARITKAARINHSSVKARRKAAQAAAARAGYQVKEWPRDLRVHAGAWLVDCAVEALPHLFAWADVGGGERKLTIQPDALVAAEVAVAEAIRPVVLPRLTAPRPWTGWRMTNDDPAVAFDVTFLRTHYKDVAAAAKAAIKDGTMQPALDGVNALQSVPWRINAKVLDVILHCHKNKIEISSLPSHVDVPAPAPGKLWDDMSNDERVLFMTESREADLQNMAMRGERVMMIEDMEQAKRLAQVERFWTPMNCDWRGRVYSLCHFNFQREDRVRSLFQFADGAPIGEDGLRWLKIHVANCGAFDKIDKQPMEARVAWVDANLDKIEDAAVNPLGRMMAWWKEADSPFLFLAACIELFEALACGPQFVTHLPVSFDGSCSGLQHLSAMTRDENTAALVNLVAGEKPQDVYGVVAERVKERIENEPVAENWPLQKLVLDYGVGRTEAKRNVMTYSYSSKKFGMASQQQVDLMDDLQKEVLQRKRPSHPFAPFHKGSKERPGKAARYIASHVFDAIEERIHRPALAMKFLQSIAKTMAHEGKPVCWTSPVGIPWINRYHEARTTCVELWMHDRGVRRRVQTKVAVGHEPEILKDKAANGVAPNFVHANDGAHLLLTTNAAVSEGITNIATVHDSFGCLASQAARFNEIIRAEMVRMYETHDVLSEVLERAKCDLTQHNWNRLPAVPAFGNLNLKEISNAAYAFA